MIQFKHFIITQFNIRLWDKDKKNVSTYTEEWLSRRFVLFDKYCFPSVQKQSRQDFLWICLFDKDTPQPYLRKIEKYQRQCPQLQACFLSKEETVDWLEYTRKVMSSFLNEKDEYIITTNLDNDDAIHLGMVEHMASLVNSDIHESLYSFNYGYQCFIDLGVVLKMKYPHNHFLTLVEKNTPDFKTIKYLPHAKAWRYFNVVNVKTEPYWIEFVHSSNVNNDLRITSRINYRFVLKDISFEDFGLDIRIKRGREIMNTITKLPPLFVRTAFRKIKRKLTKKKK